MIEKKDTLRSDKVESDKKIESDSIFIQKYRICEEDQRAKPCQMFLKYPKQHPELQHYYLKLEIFCRETEDILLIGK